MARSAVSVGVIVSLGLLLVLLEADITQARSPLEERVNGYMERFILGHVISIISLLVPTDKVRDREERRVVGLVIFVVNLGSWLGGHYCLSQHDQFHTVHNHGVNAAVCFVYCVLNLSKQE